MADQQTLVTIPVSDHGLTKDKMDRDALLIIDKLVAKGYSAYLVGGCIRDHLSGSQPKDYDIVTNAKPKQILKIFPKSLLIGRRFPLVHVRIPGKRNKVIEVATFRSKYADYKAKSRFCKWLLKFFIFGNIIKDAQRRDLSSQALYWRHSDSAILDFHNGYADIKNKKIVVIGDPKLRFEEDPVRILRILRVNAKLGYRIDDDLERQINDSKGLLAQVSPSRIFGEVIKSFHGGFGVNFLEILCHYKLENILFANGFLNKDYKRWLKLGLAHADKRYSEGLSLSAGYLFAVILWPLYLKNKPKNPKATVKHIQKIIAKQHRKTSIPKKNAIMIENIWLLQLNLQKTKTANYAKKLVRQSGFRAAYDFLLLRSEYNEGLQEIASLWESYMSLKPSERDGFKFVESDIVEE